ncbi:hypothetical protein B0H13DRAFT_1875501 [Mycena leptocephala]|nr:hypothetical protein B0H13DRAFT_1875501 [Mycena leptocephala]
MTFTCGKYSFKIPPSFMKVSLQDTKTDDTTSGNYKDTGCTMMGMESGAAGGQRQQLYFHEASNMEYSVWGVQQSAGTAARGVAARQHGSATSQQRAVCFRAPATAAVANPQCALHADHDVLPEHETGPQRRLYCVSDKFASGGEVNVAFAGRAELSNISYVWQIGETCSLYDHGDNLSNAVLVYMHSDDDARRRRERRERGGGSWTTDAWQCRQNDGHGLVTVEMLAGQTEQIMNGRSRS